MQVLEHEAWRDIVSGHTDSHGLSNWMTNSLTMVMFYWGEQIVPAFVHSALWPTPSWNIRSFAFLSRDEIIPRRHLATRMSLELSWIGISGFWVELNYLSCHYCPRKRKPSFRSDYWGILKRKGTFVSISAHRVVGGRWGSEEILCFPLSLFCCKALATTPK